MIKSVDIIIGATSFIGIALLKKLILENHTVICVIRKNSRRSSLLKSLFPEVIIIENNIENMLEVVDVIYALNIQFDYSNFYYIAWNSDFENSRYNIEGQMKNVDYLLLNIEVAGKLRCRNFLAIGSQAECGLVNEPINSMTVDNPINAYAIAKCEAYNKGSLACKQQGINFYWPRLLSAYGLYDRPHTLVMSCIGACLNHTLIDMTKGEQIWDFVYIDDVANALFNILTFGVPLKKYSIASGEGKKLKDYIYDISDVFEYPELVQGIGKKDYSANEVMYLVGDISEIVEDTKFAIKCDFKCNIKIMKNSLFTEGIIL